MNFQKLFSLQGFSLFLKILIIVALILGVVLRFVNLDGKLYSNDETFSTTYIFGHNLGQAGLIDSRLITSEELQNYQRLNADENLSQAISRLINKPFIFPPLYGILMQLWSRLWGDYSGSPAIVTRSLTALISLFALVGMYWLAWELSGSQILAWIATVLVAISPFHLQYAQIVRTYSLTTVATLLSSVCLLRAMRLNTRSSWIIYAVSFAWGLYSNLLFGFVAIAHGVYVILQAGFRFSKTLKSFILSSIIGTSLFLPWLIIFISKPSLFGYSVAQPSGDSASLPVLIKGWIQGIKSIFISLYDPWRDFTFNFQAVQVLLSILILLLIAFSFYFLCRYAPRTIRLFVLCLIVCGGGLLMLKDAVTGSTFSARLRYMIPYAIGWQLVVAYFLATQIESNYQLRKKIGEILLSVLIIVGIVSCGIIVKAETWSAFGAPDYPNIAAKINQSSHPVVIFGDLGDALTMSYILKPNTSNYLTRQAETYLVENKEKIYDGFSEVILFKPSKTTIDKLKKSTQIKLTPLIINQLKLEAKTANVWQVEKQQ